MLGVGSERRRLRSEVSAMSTAVCVGDVVEDVGPGVGATSREAEAAGFGVDRFAAARGVLILGRLEAALPGGGSLEGAALSVSERREPLGFLSGIGKYK